MKYIETVQELREVALGQVGLMTEMTHQEALAKAQLIAGAQGISAKLMVSICYKPGKSPIGADMPYPVAHFEWDLFVSQVPEYCREVPIVYVVDAKKYTAAI